MGTLAVVIEWEGNPRLSRPGVDQVLGAMAVATRPWQPAPWSLAHESAPGAVPSPACAFGVGAGVAGGGACLVSADSTLGAFDGRLDRDVLAQIGARDGVVDGAELLRAFRARGPELFARMHGDWVLVLVDFQTRTVSAARSPLGDRPLYYGRTRDRLLFATHIEQILAVEGVERVLDEQHVLEYMTWDIESAPSTAFRDIHRVAPGHRVSANSAHREPSQARYWFPRAPSREWRSDQQCMDAFSAAFERAVRERIVSHSPILAQLSGGLDSSSIVCMANRIYGARGSDDASRLAPLHVASAVYPGMDCDESELIRAVVDRVQFRAHAWDGRGAVRLEAGELASPWSLWPSGFVAGDLRIAHQLGARVILSGHGGDEIGFEVGIFRDLVRAGRWWALLRETLLAPHALAEPSSSYFTWQKRVGYFRDAWKGALPPAILRLARHLRRQQSRRAMPAWFGPRLRRLATARALSSAPPDPPATLFGAHLQAALWNGLTSAAMCCGVDACQDRAAKAGLELRFPYLDARLAELVLSIPYGRRLPHGSMRRMQREAFSGILPRQVAQRRTVTHFGGVQTTQIGLSLPQAKEILWDRAWISAPLVDQAEARVMLEALEGSAMRAETRDTAYRLRDIVLLELWLREHGIQIRS